jgi:NADP-dependent 3-hydroxy acid dehydrogenase YdfG
MTGAVKKIVDKFGGISVLIQNAGRSQRARWEHTQIQVDKDLFELNVFSVVQLTRQLGRRTLCKKCGTVFWKNFFPVEREMKAGRNVKEKEEIRRRIFTC